MKKLLSLMAALFISTAAFAGGYKGDFQLNFGAGFDSITVTQKISSYDSKIIMDSGLFTMGLETWHVFGSNDVFKFGFMVALDEGIGGTMKVTGTTQGGSGEVAPENRSFAFRSGLFIAPAFSFFVGDVVRFNVAPGLSILFTDMCSSINTTRNSSYLSFVGGSAVGAGIEIQAKFCPNARVSPVLGYRFTANFTDTLKNINSRTNNTQTLTVDSVVFTTNTFNLGISWNW